MEGLKLGLHFAGDGGYGRLGHAVQQAEFKPRKIDTFAGRMTVDDNSIVSSVPVWHTRTIRFSVDKSLSKSHLCIPEFSLTITSLH